MKIEPIVTLTKAQKKEQLARMLKKQVEGPSPPPVPLAQPAQVPVPGMAPSEDPMMSSAQPQMPERLEIPEDIPEIDSLDVDVPPAAELAAYAAKADQLWKDIGGTKSLAGKLWEMLAEDKRYQGDARDYFISTFLKYKIDDRTFRKMLPTEANLFDQIESAFEESVAPAGPVPGASPIPSIPGLPPRPGLGAGPVPAPVPGPMIDEGGQGVLS